MKRIALAALLPLLSACSGERLSQAEFFDISRQVLRFAEEDARRNQPGRVADGPLYVNVNSFRAAASKLTGHSVTEDSMSRALGEPTHAAQEQVMLCDTASGFGGCWVRKYGVWVNLNLVRASDEEVTAFVRSTSTDRRSTATFWCNRVWELDFRRQNGPWRLAGQRLRRDCRQEDE